MSKSYNNTISLRDEPAVVEKKILTMPTDPARVKRTDPGEPTICPVWQLHEVYSNEEVKNWVLNGCRTAGIGCVDCKRPVIDAIQKELAPIQENIQSFEDDMGYVKQTIAEGNDTASTEARKTLSEIRTLIGLDY